MDRTQKLRAALLACGSLAVISLAAPAFGQAAPAPQPQATVRFHITNAARKLNVVGRPQAIYKAATLGYVGRSARN